MSENRGLSFVSLLAGMGLGAGLMYVFDPEKGSRRRALARDKAVRFGKEIAWHADKQARNAVNHIKGSIAEYQATVRDRMRDIDDDQLVRRVAAQAGHVVSHPGALQITAEDGCVLVRGPILRAEFDRLKHRLDQTRGIRDYDLQVEVHDTAENVPELQGESRWQRKRREESVA